MVAAACDKLGVTAVMADHWAGGGEGAVTLAEAVVHALDTEESNFAPIYPDDMSLWDKTRAIAQKIYRAADITADQRVRNQFKDFQDGGFGHFPVCIAKTQYSFSTDPNIKGTPNDHVIPVREVRLAGGAEFIVAVCGDIMTMPGLPRVPAANSISVDETGRIVGLF